jgi:hypothetical protein
LSEPVSSSLLLLPVLLSTISGFTLAPLDAQYWQNYHTAEQTYQSKRFAQAEESFKTLCNTAPDQMTCRFYLGMSALQHRDMDTAALALAQAIVLGRPREFEYEEALSTFKQSSQAFGGRHVYPVRASDTSKMARWDKHAFPLRVYISPGLELPAGYCGADLALPGRMDALASSLRQGSFCSHLQRAARYRDGWAPAAESGINKWKWAQDEGLLSFRTVSDPAVADVYVFWTSKFTGRGKTLSTTYKDKLSRAIFVTQLPTEFDGDPNPTHQCSNEITSMLCAHEFGHVLGLDFHSPYPDDIMTAHLMVKYHADGTIDPRSPSASDRLMLKALYTVPGEIMFSNR